MTKSYKFSILLLLMVVFGLADLLAVPANPNPIVRKLPDGSFVTLKLKGDEFASWAETEDGYTLLCNKNGDYEYAVRDSKGDLQASGILARDIKNRSTKEKKLLSATPKYLTFSDEQKGAIRQIAKSRNAAFRQNGLLANRPNLTQNTQGSMRVVRFPVILVEFPNKRFTRTVAEFQALCNNLNYTATADGAITGSVRDYYRAASYNQLDMQFDVYGPFMMPDNIIAYDDESGGNPREMVRQAVLKADSAGCDFTQYDSDGDGVVDGVHIVYAGYDQSAGEPAGEAIWAHRWSVYPTENVDGKVISAYSCNSELMWNSANAEAYPDICNNKIQQIGVFCHELGHVLGLPDMYDTDYNGSGGKSVDLDKWCLMNSGSWNGPQYKGGCTPAIFTAWCREQLGWIPVREIDTTKHITIPNPHTANPATDTIILKYNTATDGEYFLIENKQKTGWDEYIPASGMLIYHIDGDYISGAGNCINCNPSHRGIYIKQAGGGAGSANTDHMVSPYPYGSNNQFTDQSTPSSINWAGLHTRKPIRNITHNTANRSILFDFMQANSNERVISVTKNPANSRGKVSGTGGIYQVGEQCTFTAQNGVNAIFQSWTENGQVVSTNSTLTFTVSTNRNLVANFDEICLTCPDYNSEITLQSQWQIKNDSITAGACKVYRFYANQGDKVTFKTGCGDGASATFDTKLDLKNSACNSIADNDDACDGNKSKIENYEITSSGYFYLKVFGYGSSNGNFSLAYKVERTATPPSTNASLASLAVSAGTLTPAFSATTLNYSVSVPHTTSSIEISATAVAGATIVGTGSKPLNYGANGFNIVVTAEDGITTKTYTIVVNRENEPVTSVENLENNGVKISPNPTKGELQVTSEKDIAYVEIVGANGSTKRFDNYNLINISDMPQGVYYLKIVFADNSIAWQKVIKQ